MPAHNPLCRSQVLIRYPKARIHRLEDGRAQVINPVGKGQFEALSDPMGSRYQLATSAAHAWVNAFQRIRRQETETET